MLWHTLRHTTLETAPTMNEHLQACPPTTHQRAHLFVYTTPTRANTNLTARGASITTHAIARSHSSLSRVPPSHHRWAPSRWCLHARPSAANAGTSAFVVVFNWRTTPMMSTVLQRNTQGTEPRRGELDPYSQHARRYHEVRRRGAWPLLTAMPCPTLPMKYVHLSCSISWRR